MQDVTPDVTRMNILLYGPAGVGKTWLASTAQNHPLLKNVLFLNVEGGLLTIASRRDIKAVHIDAITMLKTGDPALPEHHSTLEDEFWKLANGQDKYADINTVVIDSGTECQTLNLEILVAKSIAKKKPKDRDQDDIYLEDYGKSTAQLKRLFRWFRDLDKNVIITALPQYVYPKGIDEKSPGAQPVEVKPQFTQKLATSVMGYMDMVWYMYKEDNGDRKLLTQEFKQFKAKSRGIKFSRAIGQSILLKDEFDPDSKGLDLAGIFDCYLQCEGAK